MPPVAGNVEWMTVAGWPLYQLGMAVVLAHGVSRGGSARLASLHFVESLVADSWPLCRLGMAVVPTWLATMSTWLAAMSAWLGRYVGLAWLATMSARDLSWCGVPTLPRC